MEEGRRPTDNWTQDRSVSCSCPLPASDAVTEARAEHATPRPSLLTRGSLARHVRRPGPERDTERSPGRLVDWSIGRLVVGRGRSVVGRFGRRSCSIGRRSWSIGRRSRSSVEVVGRRSLVGGRGRRSWSIGRRSSVVGRGRSVVGRGRSVDRSRSIGRGRSRSLVVDRGRPVELPARASAAC